jgi:endonuclease/exonuclease/phosphatase family metal-dependent hydrolase
MRFLLAILICLITYSSYLSIIWDVGAITRFWALTVPFWQFLSLVLALLNFGRKEGLVLAMPLIMDLGFFQANLGSQLWPTHPKKSDHALQVLSWNTESLNYYEQTSSKGRVLSKQALDWLIDHPADIKFMQEFIDLAKNPFYQTQRLFSQAGQEVVFLSLYDDAEKNKHGIAIATRGKVLEKGFFELNQALKDRAFWVDIAFGERKVRAICVHLESMAFEDKSFEAKNLNKTFDRYLTFSMIRTKQIQDICDLIAQSPNPVILAGDFNDPAHSHNHFLLSKILQDGFEAGLGSGFTLRKKPYWVRIDRIYCQKPYFPIQHRVIKGLTASDHYAVETFFVLK